MKRVLKLLVAAALITAIVYLLRDRLVPAPHEPTAEPPRFRVAPEPEPAAQPVAAAEPAAASEPATEPAAAAVTGTTGHHDLTEIKGIGPVYFGRLVEAGITTLDGLASARPGEVAEWAGVTEDAAADWIAQAKDLTG